MILIHIETEKVLDKVFRGVQLNHVELLLLREFQSQLQTNLIVSTEKVRS